MSCSYTRRRRSGTGRARLVLSFRIRNRCMWTMMQTTLLHHAEHWRSASGARSFYFCFCCNSSERLNQPKKLRASTVFYFYLQRFQNSIEMSRRLGAAAPQTSERAEETVEKDTEAEDDAKSDARKKPRRKATQKAADGPDKSQAFSKRKRGITLKAYQMYQTTGAKVFTFVTNDKGNSWAYATPNFQSSLSSNVMARMRSHANLPDIPNSTKIMPHPVQDDVTQRHTAGAPEPPPPLFHSMPQSAPMLHDTAPVPVSSQQSTSPFAGLIIVDPNGNLYRVGNNRVGNNEQLLPLGIQLPPGFASSS